MPLNDTASKIMSDMKRRYGKKDGERAFYATANKQNRVPETWEKKEAMNKTANVLARGWGKTASLSGMSPPRGGLNTALGAGVGAAGGAIGGGIGGALQGATAGAVLNVLLNRLRHPDQRKSFLGSLGEGLAYGGLAGGTVGAGLGALAGGVGGGYLASATGK